jgi:hypothetical protein
MYAIGDLYWWRTTSWEFERRKTKSERRETDDFANREMKRRKGPPQIPTLTEGSANETYCIYVYA